MKLNVRLSVVMSWLMLALPIAISTTAMAQCTKGLFRICVSLSRDPRVDGECCGFIMDASKLRQFEERIQRYEADQLKNVQPQTPTVLGIRFQSDYPQTVIGVRFLFTKPTGESLPEINEKFNQTESQTQTQTRTRTFPLTNETTQAVRTYIGKGYHLKIMLETKAIKRDKKMQLQLGTMNKG